MEFDRVGNFRGVITDYGLQDAKETKSVAVAIRVTVHEFWNPELETWEDWRQWDMGGGGQIWVIKKDGTLINRNIESLVQYAGWSGNFQDVAQGEWKPTPCQFTVESETYKDQVRFKIGFVNDYERRPGGGLSKIDPAKTQVLQTQYGSQLRALAANVKTTTAPPPGKPPAPPAAKREPAPSGEGKVVAEELPF